MDKLDTKKDSKSRIFGGSGGSGPHLNNATVRHVAGLRCRAVSLDASARRPYQKKVSEGYRSSVKMNPRGGAVD